MSDCNERACVWIVFDMGGRAVAAGRNREDAMAWAEVMGVMPRWARIAPAAVAELAALARELPATALGTVPDGLPWWCEEQGRFELPAVFCPENAPPFRWRIRYARPNSEVVRECYTGPHEEDARDLIAQLIAAGNRIVGADEVGPGGR